MKRSAATVLVLLSAVSVTYAGRNRAARAGAICTSVTIPVEAVNKKYGRFVEGLDPTDFIARVNGKPAQILSAKPDHGPHGVILLLDESTSMAEPANWRFTVATASHVIARLNNRDAFGLTVFAERPYKILSVGAGRAQLLHVLARGDIFPGRKQVGGRLTALWDSILSVAGQFRNPRPGDAVLVFTDGLDTHSKHNASQVATSVLSDHIRVFTFWVHAPFTTRGPVTGQEGLDLVASRSGGAAWPPSVGWISRRSPLNSLVARVDDFYGVSLSVPAAAARKRSLNLELSLAKEPSTKDLELSYPRMLPACTAASPH